MNERRGEKGSDRWEGGVRKGREGRWGGGGGGEERRDKKTVGRRASK